MRVRMRLLNPYHAEPEYIMFESSVDPDQLASQPADQGYTVFHSADAYIIIN